MLRWENDVSPKRDQFLAECRELVRDLAAEIEVALDKASVISLKGRRPEKNHDDLADNEYFRVIFPHGKPPTEDTDATRAAQRHSRINAAGIQRGDTRQMANRKGKLSGSVAIVMVSARRFEADISEPSRRYGPSPSARVKSEGNDDDDLLSGSSSRVRRSLSTVACPSCRRRGHRLASDAGPAACGDRTGMEVRRCAAFWAAGMSGDIAQFNLPTVNVDTKFGDILKNLDFAAMAIAEVRYDRYSIFGDFRMRDRRPAAPRREASSPRVSMSPQRRFPG